MWFEMLNRFPFILMPAPQTVVLSASSPLTPGRHAHPRGNDGRDQKKLIANVMSPVNRPVKVQVIRDLGPLRREVCRNLHRLTSERKNIASSLWLPASPRYPPGFRSGSVRRHEPGVACDCSQYSVLCTEIAVIRPQRPESISRFNVRYVLQIIRINNQPSMEGHRDDDTL